MDDIFYLKRGDTSPSFRYDLIPATVDLTGSVVVFNMRHRDTQVVKISRAAAVVVVATVNPAVGYNWQPANTDTGDFYEAEYEVTYADGTIETFPNNGTLQVFIDGDIA